MKLIECHIENFGKLHDFSVSFEPGCNTFCYENGWGKSTFAAFVRVMFYGFEGENKRKGTENERKRYQPWQGGSYGGSLTFEARGKRYTVTRSFTEKKTTDIFDLRSADTNLPSTDFSENLGVELFAINSESFARTIFIGQNDCTTDATDGVHAKIGGLNGGMPDLDAYEKANDTLQEVLNKMNPRRKTGSIYKMNEQIHAMQTELSNGASIGDSLRRYEEMEGKAQADLTQNKTQQEALAVQLKKVSRQQDLRVKRESYAHFCEEETQKEQRLKELTAGFPAGVPKEEEIKEQMAAARMQKEAAQMAGLYRLSSEDQAEYEILRKQFADGMPDLEQLQTQTDEISAHVSELNRSWNESRGRLKARAAKETALAAVQKEMQQAKEALELEKARRQEQERQREQARRLVEQERKLKQQALEQEQKAFEREYQKERKADQTRLAAGIVLAVIGAVFSLIGMLWGIVLIAAGAAVIVLYLMKMKAAGKKYDISREERSAAGAGMGGEPVPTASKDVPDGQMVSKDVPDGQTLCEESAHETLEELEKESELRRQEAAAQMQRLTEELQADETFAEETTRQIREYLVSFGRPFEEERVPEELQNILTGQMRQQQEVKHSAERYEELKQKKLQSETAGQKAEWMRASIANAIQSMGFSPEEDLQTQLQQILEQRMNYANAMSVFLDAQKKKTDFEAQNDMEQIGTVSEEGDCNLEELNQQKAQLDQEAEALREQIRTLRGQMEKLREDYDAWEETKEQLEASKAEIEEARQRYRHMQKAQEYLTKAKESLTARYMEPLMRSFRNYYGIVAGLDRDGAGQTQDAQAELSRYHMDANTKITVTEQGLQRETAYFSTGYQDLIGVCLRFSLVDAMYREEKPVLILDDPFVNLDDEKTLGAGALLQALEREYQILYFTCRSGH